jgi:hypothetical protein
MNRSLPPGDCGLRSPDSLGPSGSARAVPRAVGLVGGIEDTGERETPPGGCPAARWKLERRDSGFDGVGTLAIFPFGRGHCQPHLLADRARQKPANGMWLPAGGFHELFGGDAARSLEEFQNLAGLAAFANRLGFLSAFGRFLGRAGPLGCLALLRRNVGALWRNTSLFVGFPLLTVHWRLRGGFYGQFSHFDFSFGGNYRGHDMNHSGARGKQGDSTENRKGRWNGDGRVLSV